MAIQTLGSTPFGNKVLSTTQSDNAFTDTLTFKGQTRFQSGTVFTGAATFNNTTTLNGTATFGSTATFIGSTTFGSSESSVKANFNGPAEFKGQTKLPETNTFLGSKKLVDAIARGREWKYHFPVPGEGYEPGQGGARAGNFQGSIDDFLTLQPYCLNWYRPWADKESIVLHIQRPTDTNAALHTKFILDLHDCARFTVDFDHYAPRTYWWNYSYAGSSENFSGTDEITEKASQHGTIIEGADGVDLQPVPGKYNLYDIFEVARYNSDLRCYFAKKYVLTSFIPGIGSGGMGSHNI